MYVYIKDASSKRITYDFEQNEDIIYPQRLHLIEASPTLSQFRWQESLVLHASKLTKQPLSLCYHIKLKKCQPNFCLTCDKSVEMQLTWLTVVKLLSVAWENWLLASPEYNKSHTIDV